MSNSIVTMKALFFDRAAVTGAVDRATRRALSRFGAFVRQTARRSLRTRTGSAPPGQPPHSHTGLVRRFIWFAYEPARSSVVIGPARLTGRGRGEAPSLLEHGGRAQRKARGRGGGAYRPRYRPRPFMQPAFDREHARLPALWANSVKR